MECKKIELPRRRFSRIKTIADDFILYHSERIKESYKKDNFFEELSGELEDSLNYFKENFPDIPTWIFWEVMFNKLNPVFVSAEKGEGV